MLKLYILTLVFIITRNCVFAQEPSELNESGTVNIRLGDSLKNLKGVLPLKESNFRNNFMTPRNENSFFAVHKDSIVVGSEKLKVDFFIISISKDSCVNNIFIYLSDTNELLKKHIDSKNYKKGWSVSTNLNNYSTVSWITTDNTAISLSGINYSLANAETPTVKLHFVNLSDWDAFHDFNLYLISK